MSSLLSQVVGHDKVLEKLVQSIRFSRIAPTYLFTGPSGIGKKLSALAFAQSLICEKNIPACGECPSCIRVKNLQNENLLFLQPTSGQIKIEQARQVVEFMSLRIMGRRRIVIIDEAHLLNQQAANALLKTLEEPPENSHFILVAPSASSVLPTIRSRSQLVRFSSLSKTDLTQITKAKGWVLEAAQGRVDRVEQLQEEGFSQVRNQALQAWGLLLRKHSGSLAYEKVKDLLKDREQSLFIARVWQQFLRDFIFYKENLRPLIHQDHEGLYSEFSEVPSGKLFHFSKGAHQLESDIGSQLDRGLAFENYCIKVGESLGSAH